MYNPTFIGIDGLESLPTVGKRTLDRFQTMFFPDGANVNLLSSRHSTTSAVLAYGGWRRERGT